MPEAESDHAPSIVRLPYGRLPVTGRQNGRRAEARLPGTARSIAMRPMPESARQSTYRSMAIWTIFFAVSRILTTDSIICEA